MKAFKLIILCFRTLTDYHNHAQKTKECKAIEKGYRLVRAIDQNTLIYRKRKTRNLLLNFDDKGRKSTKICWNGCFSDRLRAFVLSTQLLFTCLPRTVCVRCMPTKAFKNPYFQVSLGVFIFVLGISSLNLYAMPRHVLINFEGWRAYDWFLLESIVLMLMGGMLLVGSGGLSFQTLKTAVDYSQTDERKASEIFRKSRFVPTSFLRLGLIFFATGIILLAIFLSSL